MGNRKKLYSIAIASVAATLFLILVSSTVSASISETRITNHGTASSPAIYSNNIVWQDNRNGNWDIYIQDLSTKKQTHTTNQVRSDKSCNLWKQSSLGGLPQRRL